MASQASYFEAGLQLISQDEAHSEEDLQLMLSRAQTTGELTGPRAGKLQKAFCAAQ